MSTELVASISQTEAHTRTKLTWQEFDHTLWLATCASQQSLAESNRLSTSSVLSARSNLVIGFSDQVPLWAKATGRRTVFAEEELHAPAGPDMMIGPLVPATPQPQRKLSFGTSPSSEATQLCISQQPCSQPT